MKKGYIKLLILNCLSIIILLLSSFVLNKINYVFFNAFMIILFILMYMVVGFEKERSEKRRTVFFNVIVTTIFYLLITYVLGIIVSFYHNTYDVSMIGIVKNIVFVLPFVIFRELIRYQNVSKGRDYKSILVISTLFFIILGLVSTIKTIDLSNSDVLIKYCSMTMLPLIAKEVMLTYLSLNSGYKLTIVYCLFMELNVYYMPIFPNFGLYIDTILKIVFPAFLIALTYKVVNQKYDKTVVSNKSKGLGYVTYGLGGSAFVVLVLLVSGIIKFQLLTIGSGSMEPVINKGDAIVIEKISAKEKTEIVIGDIIAFNNDNMTIVHRVIEIVDNNGDLVYYTKGDNNSSKDGYPVFMDDIVGICRMRIPFIGYPTVLLKEVFN